MAAISFDAFNRVALTRIVRSTADIERLADLLDDRFVIPGTKIRFGYDAILGLAPGVGDLASAGLGAYIIVRAAMLGAPTLLIARMSTNLALDAAIGALPLVGDLADIAIRANKRNVVLLRRYLAKRPH